MPERMLVVAPSWVGDAILSEPLIAALQAGLGQASVDVLAPPWCSPVYARMKGVHRVVEHTLAHREVGLGKRRELARRLQAEGYARAYVLPQSFKSALVPWLARIPRRVGYVGEGRRLLLTDARRIDAKRLPRLVDRFLALAQAEGTPPARPVEPVLVPDADNASRLRQTLGLSSGATSHGAIAVLCPGAEYGPAKRWPVEHFATLAHRLALDGYEVWLIGSRNDAAETAAIARRAPFVRDLAGRTDLGAAIDLLSLATVVVCNDSGLMHAAAAVGVPLVALFGSSSPDYTPPLSSRARIARIDIVCSPCFRRICPLGHFRCMRDLGPDVVYHLAREAVPPVPPDVRVERP